ncbi:hypothetical protein NPIL_576941 [Nephila pilipes]|uniref:Uncharacterized protein n=1 Tax=Nephila pilipes TaxID=299642 RepID=A0A8X6NC77_NEPPI|nr:hypothetical protein NPIL_576941 [Nephila pilipes]
MKWQNLVWPLRLPLSPCQLTHFCIRTVMQTSRIVRVHLQYGCTVSNIRAETSFSQRSTILDSPPFSPSTTKPNQTSRLHPGLHWRLCFFNQPDFSAVYDTSCIHM